MTSTNGLFDGVGTPLDRQRFTWKELVPPPISKLDDDAFTRVRIILMNGVETDALRLKHIAARCSGALRRELAEVRRVEHHQATMVNWLLAADHSPLETTIAYEQVAIEVTAEVAQNEPDAYQAQNYRFGLLEDFDHLYRYSALLDRMEGKDSNNVVQGYTDIAPGRATWEQHRAPADDVRRPYARDAALITKIHAAMITASEYQTHDYYQNIGPLFADPVARQLYAEIASVEEQHVTQYGSMLNPDETWLEKWLIHEAMEVYTYASCVQAETQPRIKAIWERLLDYELGHLALVRRLFEDHERRDAQQVLATAGLPLLTFTSQRDFYRDVLATEVPLRANLDEVVAPENEGPASLAQREQLNRDGSPSRTVSAGYRWSPGTERNREPLAA